jgi:hypothetical protein
VEAVWVPGGSMSDLVWLLVSIILIVLVGVVVYMTLVDSLDDDVEVIGPTGLDHLKSVVYMVFAGFLCALVVSVLIGCSWEVEEDELDDEV